MLCVFVLVSFCYSQEPIKTRDTEGLKKEALKLYQEKKYDEAIALYQQIVQIKEADFGAQHLEFAGALSNLARIEMAAGKIEIAEKTMRQAISVYESKTDLDKDDGLELTRMLETVGFLRFKDKKPKAAIDDYQRVLQLKIKYTGIRSLETAAAYWQLGNLYAAVSDFQNSFEYYEKVLRIRTENIALFGYDDVDDVLRRYQCVAGKSGNLQQEGNLINVTKDIVNKERKQDIHDGGTVNGKAVKLVTPPYPAAARAWGQGGQVDVQVTIDETGKVIFACARSGFPVLYENSEAAALSSKFLPTLINGKPVKVVGIIVYHFVR